MSSRLLPEAPALLGLRPAPPEWQPVEGHVAWPLLQRLGGGELLALAGSRRHFRHRARDGRERFLRLVDAAGRARQLGADRIARHLHAQGVSCLCLEPGGAVELEGGRWLLMAPFVEHRFATASAADLQALGRELARMHRALSRLPEAAACRARTEERLALLRRRAAVVLERPQGAREEQLRHLLEEDGGSLWSLLEGGLRQCTHGDLHYANVIWPLAGGAPLLLDFEDSPAAWFDPVLDLAQVQERFVLTAGLSAKDREALTDALLEGYGEGGGRIPELDLPGLLQALALRALLTLAELEVRGGEVPAAEWDKFVTLHAQAGALREVPA